MLDWAETNGIGFSSVISTGASADLDFGEILDYLAFDTQTQGILLYIEGIRDARRFMSALRATARFKPVIMVKVGRHAAGSKAVQSHTGALVGSDAVFDALVRRAGVVRVQHHPAVVRLGAGAVHPFRPPATAWPSSPTAAAPASWPPTCAVDLGVRMAELSAATIEALNSVLPADLVARQSARHHRRCHGRALPRGGGGLPRRRQRRRRAGDADAAGDDPAD